MLISREVTLSGSDFLPCFNNRRALSPLPMFSHLSEYLFKAMKTASKKEKKEKEKKEKKKRKRKTSSTSKDRNLVRLSLLTPAYTALLTQMRSNWRLPGKVKSHELKFHQ